MDLVSIIIPVYNMESSLESCVRSILKQDYESLEILLVDDGSKDNSFKICQELSENDSRVRCFHTENRGSGPARNHGISESRGKYLYFPDADDYLEPYTISTLVKAMEGGVYDLVVFGYKILTHTGQVLKIRDYEPFSAPGDEIRRSYANYFGMEQRYSIQGAPWNKFFDGDIVRNNGISFPPLRRHQDEGFIARYMTVCRRVRFIPEILYHYWQNTVGIEWQKYPVDYMDAVIGLRDVWNETLMQFSPEDFKTHEMIRKEIFSKMIKALQLSYSPKMKLNVLTRRAWLSRQCKRVNFAGYSWDTAGSAYQKAVLCCAKLRLYFCLSLVLYAGKIKSVIRLGK